MLYKKLGLKLKLVAYLLSVLFVFVATTAFCEDLSGNVVETMNSGGYTYIQLDKNGSRQWVAIPESLIRVGDEVIVSPGVSMGAYSSSTLGRSFDEIIFSAGIKEITKRVVGSGSIDESSEAKKEDLNIEKAPGDNAYRIEEIFAQKKALDGKNVTVRGKVVKISKYQGKTWLRIVDGTGSRKRGNHKLIVTSDHSLEKDEIVTVTGTVSADKSFGALAYEVVVEDAQIVK
nr:DNA-binding protein [Desulfobulbaceae bacterium]